MASKHKQRGWLNVLAAAIPAVVGAMGAESSNDANADINSAQRAFNAQEAQKTRENNAWEAEKTRDYQTRMRATQYTTAIGDMKAAGLNPMLAYNQGGAGTPQGATASGGQANAGTAHRMENTMSANQAGLSTAFSAAMLEKTAAETDAIKAQAEKTREEIPLTTASAGKVRQETSNLEETLGKIIHEIDNVKMDTLLKEEQITLVRAQQQLTNIQKDLTRGNISYVEAQKRATNATATITELGKQKAKNEETYEKHDYRSSGDKGILQNIKEVINLINPLR